MECEKTSKIFIYEIGNDNLYALTNETTAPRVRHRAIEFNLLFITNNKNIGIHYSVTRETRRLSVAIQLLGPLSVSAGAIHTSYP